MNKIMKTISIFILAMILGTGAAFSQCKGFTKKECVPQIKPFTYNGQLNMAVLNPGDVAELVVTFYKGQDYRLFVCSQENLGKIEFKLLDSERNTLFYNKEHDYVNFWDFHSNATQQLIVQVRVPQIEEEVAVAASGCVSILIGFKE
jgi:hypothetical protein